MKNIYPYKEAVWIDLLKPTEAEIQELVAEYALDTTIAESLLSPSSSHRIAISGKLAHLVLHFPAFKDAEDGDAAYELDTVVGDNFVITARYGKVEALEKFKHELTSGTIKDGGPARDDVFFAMMLELIKNYTDKLSHIDHWTRDIEKGMFGGREKQTILQLSEASRHLIDFRKITSVWPEAFSALIEDGKKRFGEHFSNNARLLNAEFVKASAKRELLADAVRELRDTNDALLSAKQNELTRYLAIIALATDIIVGTVLIYFSYLALK